MSYDLEIYTVREPKFIGELFDRGGYVSRDNQKLIIGSDWQIAIYGPDKVEEEDLADDISRAMPGLHYLTAFHVEPHSAPEKARSLAREVARTLAKAAHGVVVDQQAGTISTPKGVKRYTGSKTTEGVTVALGFFFMDLQRFRQSGLVQLVDLIEARLPELLPRRYGRDEPPQYKWEEHGKDHFLSLMQQSEYRLVWYAYQPAQHVFLELPDPPGADRRGFRVGHLCAELSDQVLSDTGWDRQLLRWFLAVSSLLMPFYAEIRLGSVIPQSCWWYGIPPVRGKCTLIGPPYLDLWPQFAENAKRTKEGLAFIDSFTADSHTSRDAIPPVPDAIASAFNDGINVDPATGDVLSWTIGGLPSKYPEVWPFEGPTA